MSLRWMLIAIGLVVLPVEAQTEILGRYYDPQYTSNPNTSCALPSDSVVSFSKGKIDFHELACKIRKIDQWPNGQDQRAGPGCLNRISASISGASAGFRPPSGMAAG